MGGQRSRGEREPTLIIFLPLPSKKCWEELGEAQATILDNTTLLDPVNIATMYVVRLLTQE
jgi:hypothetical protein